MAWSNNIGASRPEVVDAAFAQARELSHLRSNFDSVPLLRLAHAMTKDAPGGLKRIGFTLHGSLAVEMAMKLALANRPGHTGPFLALTDGYHGRSLASMGLGWPHTNHAFDRTFPAVLRVPQPYAYRSGRSADEEVDYCIGELRDAIARRATGLPPALIMEPVQGNGTQLDFPDRYYREVRQVCSEHGILLIFDEVQTGFGRTGRMWAAEYYDVTPDILVFGKGVGGGFPLAGVLADAELHRLPARRRRPDLRRIPGQPGRGNRRARGPGKGRPAAGLRRPGQVRDRRPARDAAAAPRSSATSADPASSSASSWYATRSPGNPRPRRRWRSTGGQSTSG